VNVATEPIELRDGHRASLAPCFAQCGGKLRAPLRKNFKTIMKEAEKHVGAKYVDQVIDPLYVVEKAMHHFFMLAESRKEIGGKLEEVNQLYERAAHRRWRHRIGMGGSVRSS
jgi:hypothetical protein